MKLNHWNSIYTPILLPSPQGTIPIKRLPTPWGEVVIRKWPQIEVKLGERSHKIITSSTNWICLQYFKIAQTQQELIHIPQDAGCCLSDREWQRKVSRDWSCCLLGKFKIQEVRLRLKQDQSQLPVAHNKQGDYTKGTYQSTNYIGTPL